MKLLNGFAKKIMRFFTAFLPVHESRAGACKRCGACCKLPVRCMFYSDSGCKIYGARPLQCRKFPRTEREQKVVSGCGYKFR